MATGDITWFQEATPLDYFAGWAASDVIKVAILTNGTNPTAADTTPALGDYTEVTPGGNYVAGGIQIGTWGGLWSQNGADGLFDSAINPYWLQDALNPTNAYWGLMYNDTQGTDPAIAYIDLAGPVNMSTHNLRITWNVSGIATTSVT